MLFLDELYSVQANLYISNSDRSMSNSSEILITSNSLSQSNMLIESWLGDFSYKSELPEVQINLHFG